MVSGWSFAKMITYWILRTSSSFGGDYIWKIEVKGYITVLEIAIGIIGIIASVTSTIVTVVSIKKANEKKD